MRWFAVDLSFYSHNIAYMKIPFCARKKISNAAAYKHHHDVTGIGRFCIFPLIAIAPICVWAHVDIAPATELETVRVQARKSSNNEENMIANTAAGVLRSNAPLFETAQSISVLTRHQIETKQARTVAEALEGVAGVSAGAYGRRGWDDFIIRGQISSAQTYVDGLRVQTSTSVLRSEDIFGIGSIEIVKGPTSVGFGLALPGGLVNLTTKRPQAQTFHRVGVSYGSYGLKEANFDINHARNGTTQGAFRVVGRVSDQDDPTDHVYFKNQYMAASYNFDLSNHHELSIIASYQRRKYIRNQGLPHNYQHYGRRIFTGEPDRHYDVNVYRMGADYTHYFAGGWTLRNNLALTDNRSWSNSVFSSANAKFPLIAREISYQDKQDFNIASDHYLQRTFAFKNANHEMTAGIDMLREKSDYYRPRYKINPFDADNPIYGITSIGAAIPSHNTTYTQYAGLYIRNSIKIDHQWNIGLSARHDWTKVEIQNNLSGKSSANSDRAVTGSASLMYQQNAHIAPYASYSTSFMPVTDSGEGGALLNPEQGKQIEFGIKFQALQQHLQGYMAYYDLRRTNITQHDAALGYSIQTGEQTSRGFEVEVAALLQNRWNVSASYSHIPVARITKSLSINEIGQRINHVPRHAGGLFARYDFTPGQPGWNMGMGIRSQGARTAQRGAYFINLPNHTVVDANVGYGRGNWTLHFGIKNLFNKDYIQGTTPAVQLVNFGSPRTFVLNANIRF